MRARINGVAAQMKKFDYFFGLELERKCLFIVDNLSRSLQASTMSACEGQEIVKSSVKTLQSMRNEENLFWKYVERRLSEIDVSTPELPCPRKVPLRFEVGEATPEYPITVQDHYRRIYFEVINFIVSATTGRFQQKGFQILQKLEVVLTQSDASRELVNEVSQFYGSKIIFRHNLLHYIMILTNQ